MDGNARWAQQQGLPALRGYEQGVVALRSLVSNCCQWGIPALTVRASALYPVVSHVWGASQRLWPFFLELVSWRRARVGGLGECGSVWLRVDVCTCGA